MTWMSVSLSLCVCLCMYVCLQAYLQNYTTHLQEIFLHVLISFCFFIIP